MLALPCGVFVQSPLTVQPSTGRVGIGNTNPSEALDVSGTAKAAAFQRDGSQSAKAADWWQRGYRASLHFQNYLFGRLFEDDLIDMK